MSAEAGSSAPPSWDLTRILLAVVAIGGLIAASFWVLRPFLLATVWATMIVVATWPALGAVQARLWGKRGLAVTVMTVTMLIIVVAPIAVAVVTVVEHGEAIVVWSRSFAKSHRAGLYRAQASPKTRSSGASGLNLHSAMARSIRSPARRSSQVVARRVPST